MAVEGHKKESGAIGRAALSAMLPPPDEALMLPPRLSVCLPRRLEGEAARTRRAISRRRSA